MDGRNAIQAALRRQGELILYLAAGVGYVTLGVLRPAFLFSWAVAVSYLILTVVVLPALVRRLRR